MFAFGLKKTQVVVAMALLLLNVAVYPHSGYPHAEEDEGQTGTNQEDEENQGWNQDNDDEDLEQDQDIADQEGTTSVGNADAEDCIKRGQKCVKEDDPKCCNAEAESICKLYKGQYLCLPCAFF